MNHNINKTTTHTSVKTAIVINPVWLMAIKVVRNLTFREMGKMFGCSPSFISDCLQGYRQINADSEIGKKILKRIGCKNRR